MCFVGGLLSAGKSETSAHMGGLKSLKKNNAFVLQPYRTESFGAHPYLRAGGEHTHKHAALISRREFNGYGLSVVFKT